MYKSEIDIHLKDKRENERKLNLFHFDILRNNGHVGEK